MEERVGKKKKGHGEEVVEGGGWQWCPCPQLTTPPPYAMVWPHVVGQVQELAAHCYCCCVPMVPFGIGRYRPPCGAPWQGSICFDLSCMDALELSLEDFQVAVEPGVTCEALNSHLQSTGLWFPVDPGANASLCGMMATGTSGTNMVCFGTMHPNVLNLHVVLSDRCLLHTAGPGASPGGHQGGPGWVAAELALTHQPHAGRGWLAPCPLFMDSKGTLGFFIQAMLHLHPLPKASAATAFPSMQAVMDCTMQVLQNITLVAHIGGCQGMVHRLGVWVLVAGCSPCCSWSSMAPGSLAKQQRKMGRHSTSVG
ncbi:LOW QUALITY PROTEIN: probable D-lactate dehydrogenase, mitochondrial [Lathamus discolor]|uniref:LOW QUALITY PROTEIN: probable D-lactate dehydrogenase, mitochondrial n=1 Tax=Lathamus discolor TaxID=678569 RepID=UPI0032B83C4C